MVNFPMVPVKFFGRPSTGSDFTSISIGFDRTVICFPRPKKSLNIEFIGNCRTGKTVVLATERLRAQSTTVTSVMEVASVGADNKSCFIRARVRLDKDLEPDLMAYTNPVRFLLR